MIEFNPNQMTEVELIEAANTIFSAQEKDFEKLKSEKWYKTFFRAITLNQDGKKYAVRGINSLTKLQQLFMDIYVRNYRTSHNQLNDTIRVVTKNSEAIKKLFGMCVLNIEKQESLEILDAIDAEILALFLGEYTDENGTIPAKVREYNRGVLMALNQKIPTGSLNNHQLRKLKAPKVVYRCFMEQCAIDGTIETQMWSDKIYDHLKDFELSENSKAEIKASVMHEAEVAGIEYFIVKYSKDNGSVLDTDFVIGLEESHSSNNTNTAENQTMLSRAESLFLKYKIADAVQLFNILAEQGNSRSCYFLGQIYRCGYGTISRNDEKAFSYWQQGTDAGDCLCALRFAEENDDEYIKSSIFKWAMEKAIKQAEDGDIYAMFEIARAYAFSNPESHDRENAYYWYTLASNRGLWAAMAGLGNRSKEDEKYDDAVRYYQMAADLGYDQAMCSLAELFWLGDKIEEDENRAISLFQQAAAAGNIGAMSMLGYIFAFRKDYSTARYWYQNAVDHGDTSSYFDLYTTYYCGKSETHESVMNNQTIKLNNRELGMAALLMGAIYGNDISVLELAGRGLHGDLTITTDWLKRLRATGKLMVEKIVVDNTPFPSDETFRKDLMAWAKKYLQSKASEENNYLAQYYLGAKAAKNYKDSKNPLDKNEAQQFLIRSIETMSECVDELSKPERMILYNAKELYKKIDNRFSKWITVIYLTGSFT